MFSLNNLLVVFAVLRVSKLIYLKLSKLWQILAFLGTSVVMVIALSIQRAAKCTLIVHGSICH